jgi:hypothetical protein
MPVQGTEDAGFYMGTGLVSTLNRYTSFATKWKKIFFFFNVLFIYINLNINNII